MKQRTRRTMAGIGSLGATLIILAIVMAIAEGYVSDATYTTGNLAPASLTGLVGAGLMFLGFGSILFRRE